MKPVVTYQIESIYCFALLNVDQPSALFTYRLKSFRSSLVGLPSASQVDQPVRVIFPKPAYLWSRGGIR